MKIPEYVNEKYWFKSYPKELTAELFIPRVSLPDLIEEGMRRNKDRVAVIYSGREIQYAELQERIDHFAAALYGLGVRKGETVALFLSNCPPFACAYYGALKIGATVTALSPQFAAPEVAFQIQDSQAKTLIMQEEFWPKVEALRDRLNLQRIILVNLKGENPVGRKPAGIHFYEDLFRQRFNPAPRAAIDPEEDVAALQYTGGTTGLPKGAMLTHQNIVANIVQMRGYLDLMEKRDRVGQPVVMAVLPWYHIYGQTVDLSATLDRGGTLVVLPGFDAELALEAIQRTRPHIFMGVSTMFVTLLNHPRLKEYDLKSLRWCNNGASSIPSEVVERFEEMTGVRIVEGYGLSEASPVTHTTSPYLTRKIGSVGLPLPNTLQGIIDPATCEFLAPGEVGEVVVQGPQVMKGYWKKPEETEKVFLWLEGRKWLRTGDIGVLDEEGYLTLTDRAKDLIKYKGHSVYPREVEEVLYQHPAVKEAAVVGVFDSLAGENIKAFVVLKDEYRGRVKEEEMISWSKERLAAYKYPRLLELRPALPKSPVGKILRRVLREE